jgi:protein gp37
MDELTAPMRTRKPAVIGVQFMGDLFHENVPNGFIRDVWQAMTNAQQHTFIVLTKRPERMLHWYTRIWEREPLPNVIVGVSIEDQATADKRIPLLLQTPAACRVVSLEPMLGPVDLHNESGFERRYDYDWLTGENYRWDDGTPAPQQNSPNLNWVIMGCESGPGARPMQIEWARSIKAQCVAAGIPLFYKQGPGDDGVVCGMPVLDGQVWAQKPEREQP